MANTQQVIGYIGLGLQIAEELETVLNTPSAAKEATQLAEKTLPVVNQLLDELRAGETLADDELLSQAEQIGADTASRLSLFLQRLQAKVAAKPAS